MYDIISLDSKELGELREIGRQLNIPKVDRLEKQELVERDRTDKDRRLKKAGTYL